MARQLPSTKDAKPLAVMPMQYGALLLALNTILELEVPVTEQELLDDVSRLKNGWRCYHCDFFATTREEAEAHFGDGDEASEFVPLCKWWTKSDEAERMRAYQEVVKDLAVERDFSSAMRAEKSALEDKVAATDAWIKSHWPTHTSLQEVFNTFHSQQGELLVALLKLSLLATEGLTVQVAGHSFNIQSQHMTKAVAWIRKNCLILRHVEGLPAFEEDKLACDIDETSLTLSILGMEPAQYVARPDAAGAPRG